MAPTLEQITQGRCSRSRSVDVGALHEVSYDGGTRLSVHRHRSANITLLVGGDLREVVEGEPMDAGSLCLLFKPSAFEHSTIIGPRGVRSLVLELDPATERSMRRQGDLFDRCRWTDDLRVVASFTRLWKHAATPGVDVNRLVGQWLRDVPAHATLLAPWRNRNADAMQRPEALVRAMARIDREFAHPLGPAGLADDLAMHPVSVARLFRRHLGRSVKECLHAARVRHSADWLAQSRKPLARIALDAGYCDQAHLSREFRRWTGLTPGEYRRLARGPHAA